MIDPKKQYRTSDGRDVRIYAVDGGGDYPVHGAIKNTDGWFLRRWWKSGKWVNQETVEDLIEVKPRIKRDIWVNVYADRSSITYDSREEADRYGSNTRIACVMLTIDCEEGEGL